MYSLQKIKEIECVIVKMHITLFSDITHVIIYENVV